MRPRIRQTALLSLVVLLLASCRGEEAVTAPLPSGQHVHGGAAAPASEPDTQADSEVAYYTCAMHPSVRSAEPGACPICGMALQPVTRTEAETGVILIDAQRRQTIGVTTARVERHPLVLPIRAVGRVMYDQTRLADVTLKVGELHADTLGQAVEKGEPLFTLYSPELYAAQEELLTAVASSRAARDTAAPDRVDYLVEAARRRLRLWDLQPGQIDRIARGSRPLEQVPILSPATGAVIEKNIVAGAAVQAGERLYRIADLRSVWIEAQIYEADLALVGVGDTARMSLPYRPGWQSEARVTFVYPYLDDATRTGRVRLDLDNAGGEFKPDMFANVELEKHLGDHVAVPSNAVLYAGERSFVFVDLGEGRLRPKAVDVGRRAGDFVEIRAGVAEGDIVVTSGTFLVAAEARLKVDMEHWK